MGTNTHSCQEFSCQLLRANTTHYPSLAATVNYCCIKAQLFSGRSAPAET